MLGNKMGILALREFINPICATLEKVKLLHRGARTLVSLFRMFFRVLLWVCGIFRTFLYTCQRGAQPPIPPLGRFNPYRLYICVRSYGAFISHFGEPVKCRTCYGVAPGSIPAKVILQCGEILSVAVRIVTGTSFSVRIVAVRIGTQPLKCYIIGVKHIATLNSTHFTTVGFFPLIAFGGLKI